MNKEQRDLLYQILEILIDAQSKSNKSIEILQKEIKLLNTKINILKNKHSKGCCKCSK